MRRTGARSTLAKSWDRQYDMPLLALMVLFLPGCFGASDRAPDGEVVDAPARALIETFRLGGAEPTEAEMFESWPRLVVDDAGHLYVLHQRQGRVAVFDQDGAFSRWIGAGSGRGPGEFNSPRRLGLLGDSIWIRNLNPPHITVFNPEGTLVRTDQVLLGESPGMMSASQGLSGYMVGGHAWVEPDSPPSALEEGAVPWSTLELGTREPGVARDTVLTWRSNRYRLRGLHFDPIPEPPFFAIAPDGSVVVLAEWSDDEPDRIHLRTVEPDGNVRWQRDLKVPTRPIPRAERDSIVQQGRDRVSALRESLLDMGLPTAGVPTIPTETEALELIYLPTHRPPLRDVRRGSDGTIWIQLEELGDGEAWLAIDESDGVLFRIELPEGARFGQATCDAVWYVESDELGVTWVVRAAIQDVGEAVGAGEGV